MEAQLKDADSKHHECCKVIAEHKTLEAELLKVRGALRMDGDQLRVDIAGLSENTVVGGADKGGIIVREDLDLNSPALSERLATGAQVKELDWQELLVQVSGQKEGLCDSTSEGEPSSGSDAEAVVAEKELSKEEEEAFEQYVGKFGENRAGEAPGYNRQAFPWTAGQPLKKATPKEAIEAVLEANRPKKTYQPPLTEVDSEGEEVPLCTRCSMPVGQFAYEGRQGIRSCVHAECMAQVLVEDAQRHEDRRTTWEVEKKLKSRNEYEIGWRPDSVPQNAHLAERMGCNTPAPGLCCLVLDEASRTVKVAPTLEPAAAVNLEYLLLALKVRKTAKREPLFSLDPVDHQNLEKTPQKKVYEPSWLAGTSVGDVMFQADYFLKELALGEYTMPVAGMMSVFDWSELSAAERDRDWSGREWFVVRKAEVRMAMDQTLIPVVKMGVEAREQVLTKGGLEDAAVTAATHPLKKFADAFSRNFDLIAERRSVVFHLRELAKASVMAKHLVDSNIRVNSTWYQLADEIVKGTAPEAHPQIPQLWNMRGNSRIQLKNGRLIDMLTGGQRKLHAIYGGVEFGLDRFELAQRHAMQGQAGMQLGQSGRPMFMPQRIQIGQQAQVPSMPQGVDLNLDKFNLSNIERFASHLPACSGTSDSLATKVTLGKAFLKSLRERKYPGLKQEYEEVLLKVFESPECDRSQEGDAFIPPDPSMEYTGRIRSLVNEEKLLLERRQMHFFDKAFQVGNAGPDFPRSWTSRIQVEKDGAKTDVSQRKMLTKVDFDPAFASVLANDILPTAAPEFKKDTEDGSTFRIYQIGSLEVRTTQMKFGQEKVGAMFSSGAPAWELKSKATVLAEDEKLQECKVFIEATDGPAQGHQPHHFYLVFKTVQQNVIVIEQLANGSRSWAVNPTNLEDRNSLAKQLFTAVCTEGATVHALKMVLPTPTAAGSAVSLSVRKQYAKLAFKQMTGQTFTKKWGGSVRRASPEVGPAVSLDAPHLGMPGGKKRYNLLG
ncbi:NADPH-dependent diflavin oxidoreductase 1 [Durusdinium trenchii]|uniref:NADPH-dependent diflavin oxidoreductase 1 n=1 Tax=Durusdinium trenchii TaxID=1381693 RepID=A0ABP0S3F8_9DINO